MRSAIEAMQMAVNALEPFVPSRVLADVRRRWVAVERGIYELEAEIESLRSDRPN